MNQACQASLSITNTQSSLKLLSIESVMPSSHLILCCPLLLLPPIPPSIRVFSNESTLSMRWPKYWHFSFSISSSYEHPRLISFRMDWLDLLAVQGTLKSLLQYHSSKASILQRSAFFTVWLSVKVSHCYCVACQFLFLCLLVFFLCIEVLLCFSCCHVWMWELDCEEDWALKNWTELNCVRCIDIYNCYVFLLDWSLDHYVVEYDHLKSVVTNWRWAPSRDTTHNIPKANPCPRAFVKDWIVVFPPDSCGEILNHPPHTHLPQCDGVRGWSLKWVHFSCWVMSYSLQPHESQHASPPCPSPTPRVHSDSRPSSQWCQPSITSSVVPFSSCPQSLPASESFPMSQLFTWGGQSIRVSVLASFLPKKSQGWSPLEWTGWISLQSEVSLESFFQHHNSKASILQCSAFFTVQLGVKISYC